jgi:hypothetical protein
MEIETNVTQEEEKEPVLYNPKTLSLVANATGWVSWLVLAGFLADVVAQFLSLQSQIGAQGMSFADLFKEVGFVSYLITNLVTPFVTGIAWFVVLQAASVGLNVLLEMDFNLRDED